MVSMGIRIRIQLLALNEDREPNQCEPYASGSWQDYAVAER